MNLSSKAIAVVGLLLSSSCSIRHINEYVPKQRQYDPPVKETKERQVSRDGSLFTERSEGATLFTDVRAFQVNDIVTVNISEVAKAKRSAGTAVGRDTDMNFGGDVGGLIARHGNGIDPKSLLHANASTDFEANGSTARNDDVHFTVAATVKQVLPNGNLFIEGHRVVLLNNEEHHFYISGVARANDISRRNTIASHQLADAEVEFVGDGVLTEAQDPGWLTRLLNWLKPI